MEPVLAILNFNSTDPVRHLRAKLWSTGSIPIRASMAPPSMEWYLERANELRVSLACDDENEQKTLGLCQTIGYRTKHDCIVALHDALLKFWVKYGKQFALLWKLMDTDTKTHLLEHVSHRVGLVSCG